MCLSLLPAKSNVAGKAWKLPETREWSAGKVPHFGRLYAPLLGSLLALLTSIRVG